MSACFDSYAAKKQTHDGDRHIGERRSKIGLGKHHQHGNTNDHPGLQKIRP